MQSLWRLPVLNRIFHLIDEKRREDEGYVTLVNAKEKMRRKIAQSVKREPACWAWKHPHLHDGSVDHIQS